MIDDIYFGIIMGLITGAFLGFMVGFEMSYFDSINSKTPITPIIEIRIETDGTQDTTYVYEKP